MTGGAVLGRNSQRGVEARRQVGDIPWFGDEVVRTGVRISSITVGQDGDRRRLELDVALPRSLTAPHLVARIADVPDVADVRWD